MPSPEPRLVVFTTLFPHAGQPGAGLFVRERMFRVAKVLPVTVVAPVPWFPMQGVLRRWKPGFRPAAPSLENQDGVEVRHPRFLSVPGAFKSLDGFFIAVGSLPTMLRLKRSFAFNVIDAHFAYPDGYAATLLGRWLHVPVTITLRGTEVRHVREERLKPLLIRALQRATRIFSVSSSLKDMAVSAGIAPERIEVIGNGVDLSRFSPIARGEARARLGIATDARVLISVGGLVERKGFHRVLELLPELRKRHPGLVYLIVGGPSAEGDWTERLKAQVKTLALDDCVRFLGPLPPNALRGPLSAADVFVLATSNEGWANVFLEAMACGLPVVTTDVGGNREVVNDTAVGVIVAFGDPASLGHALDEALTRAWDRQRIRRYAEANAWDGRITSLVEAFRAVHANHGAHGSTIGSAGSTPGSAGAR